MKGIRSIEGWRAEEIAKVYLLNSGLVTVSENNLSENFDLLAMSKNTPDKKIGVEVKATKYSKSEIKRAFKETREKLSNLSLPTILIYVNNDKENGYFEVFKNNKKGEHDLQPLRADKIKEEILDLID